MVQPKPKFHLNGMYLLWWFAEPLITFPKSSIIDVWMGSEYKELLIATINPIAYVFMILTMRNLKNDAKMELMIVEISDVTYG